jgi:hypothetical protein
MDSLSGDGLVACCGEEQEPVGVANSKSSSFYNSKPNQTTIHTREIKDGGL